MSKRRIILIKVGLILLISINLINNIHRQKEEVRRKYISYICQEFDRDLQIRRFAFHQQFIRPIVENRKREEILKIEKQQKVLSRGGNTQEKTFILTFYTGLIEENSEAGAVTCNGSKLRDGIVANNILRQGTIIITREYGELIVADKGGNNFNTINRLDVFVPRKKGENDYQYKKRVNTMGVVKIKGYIIR